MAKQKWRNRSLQRGVLIDRARGYVYVRYKRNGIVRKELIGRTTDTEVVDRANFRAEQLRARRRAKVPDYESRRQRLLVEDAADLFQRLHGEKRPSKKGAKQFARYVRLIKKVWGGKYVDTITGDDMRDYRHQRRTEGVSESTINREQTAIITMFNKLVAWRRAGHIPSAVVLPEENPGRAVRKVSEDRYIVSVRQNQGLVAEPPSERA